MKSNGIMVLTSNTYGRVEPLSDRANKNNEYSEVGGATLRDNGIDTYYLPKYLLEEFGRWVKDGLSMEIGIGMYKQDGGTNKVLCSVMKVIRLNGGSAKGAETPKESRKVSLPCEAWEVLEHYARTENKTVSEMVELFTLAGLKMEVTSKEGN